MKPGISWSITAGSLPASRSTSHTHSVMSTRVCLLAHTSTSGISCGGYQKCVAITRSGCATSAISALAGWPLDEASTTDGAQILSSRPNRPRFSARSSVTASITSCASAASSSRTDGTMRVRMPGIAACSISPWRAKSVRLTLILSSARPSEASSRPIIATRLPAIANTCAMPCPMMPLPMTATVSSGFMRTPAACFVPFYWVAASARMAAKRARTLNPWRSGAPAADPHWPCLTAYDGEDRRS